MIVNSTTRRALAARRQRRELLARGYEEVGETGGQLWELARGFRYDHHIVDAVISEGGQSIFVKIEPRQRDQKAA